jgi:hypothetical protein
MGVGVSTFFEAPMTDGAGVLRRLGTGSMANIPRVALNIVGPSSGLLTGAAVALPPPSVE